MASLSPTGLVSGFFSPGRQVLIAAPGDFNTQSRINGKFTDFSGTSASQPLVFGAISNVLSLLPGVNATEITQLIERTAIPTVNSAESPRLNGAGHLAFPIDN